MFGHEFPFIDPAGNPVAAHVSGNLSTTSIAVMRAALLAGLGLWLCPPFIVLREAFDECDLPYRVDVVDWQAISTAFRGLISADRQCLARASTPA